MTLKLIKESLIFATFIFLAICVLPESVFANAQQNPNKDLEIRFNYYPNPLGQASHESIFLTIGENGKATVVLYEPSVSTVTSVYEGTLPKAVVIGLLNRVNEAQKEIREILQRETRKLTIDGPTFYLALIAPLPKAEPHSVEHLWEGEVSESVWTLIKELRALWRRLRPVQSATAYLRGEPIEKKVLEYAQQNSKRRPITVAEFPHKLQPMIVEAIKNPLKFYALSRTQLRQFRAFNSKRSYLSVAYKYSNYMLSLLRPSKDGSVAGIDSLSIIHFAVIF